MSLPELNEKENLIVRDILGYLNFSSGNHEPRFFKAWNSLFAILEQYGVQPVWSESRQLLTRELAKLNLSSDAFRNTERVEAVLQFVFDRVLPSYLDFHKDVLYHQNEVFLFNSFFMARVCETVLARFNLLEHGEDKEKENLVLEIIQYLSDFIGYRPIPVLEGEEKHEPNPHEWIAPLSLYCEDAGVACGPYQKLVTQTLEILRSTDPGLLHDAWFDPDKVREIVMDPRAYDFDHPVNRRPNYSFGTWDPHYIDKDGYYRRFVVHQITVDGILGRVKECLQEGKPESEIQMLYYEAGAVLAGTMLMGSGISGDHVQAHDSTVSLSTLMPLIADYRDRFYELLIQRVPGEMKTALQQESLRLFQPFGGARQSLNKYLARQRANQLQRFHLARTFARMGYFNAAIKQTEIIAVASARFLCQIDCHMTEAHLLTDKGDYAQAATHLPLIEDLLRRGIDCGALPDPWYILGFGAQYSLFPSVDNTIHDHRIDDLIGVINDIFDLYSRLEKECAVHGENELLADLSDRMSSLAGWWDQFGSTEVSDIEGVSGQDVWESASKVSNALAVWYKAGNAAGDVAFWQRHVDRFTSSKAFVLLCEALLEQNDLISSMALIMHWLGESERIPLQEGDYSFNTIILRWVQQLAGEEKAESNKKSGSGKSLSASKSKDSIEKTAAKQKEISEKWDLLIKFMDRLEANADTYWTVPVLDIDPQLLDDDKKNPTSITPPKGNINISVMGSNFLSSLEKSAERFVLSKVQCIQDLVHFVFDFRHMNHKIFDQSKIQKCFKSLYQNEDQRLPFEKDVPLERAFSLFNSWIELIDEFVLCIESLSNHDNKEFFELVKPSLAAILFGDSEVDDDGKEKTKTIDLNSMEAHEIHLEKLKEFFHLLHDTKTNKLNLIPPSKDTSNNNDDIDIKQVFDQLIELLHNIQNDNEVDKNIDNSDNYDDYDGIGFDFDDFASIDHEDDDNEKTKKDNDSYSNFDLELLNELLDRDLDDDDDVDSDDDSDDVENDLNFLDYIENLEDADSLNDLDYESYFDFEDDDSDEDEDEEDDLKGIDPTYKAAYDNMTFQDSADDGVDDEMMEEKYSDGDDSELSEEMDRINDRLTFIYTLVKLWKFAASRSILLKEPEESAGNVQQYLEAWLNQTQIYRKDLTKLLDETFRYRVPKPCGTAESLVEYDQLLGTKEILLDRIIWTIVEVSDVILYIDAILLSKKEKAREENVSVSQESSSDDTKKKELSQTVYEKRKQSILNIFAAILSGDVQGVRKNWKTLLFLLNTQTLLYIPTSRGGDPDNIVQCRCLQQIVLRLLEYLPRLGMITETFEMLRTVQVMEGIRPSMPGAITEFDRLFETATRSLANVIAASSKRWRLRADDSLKSVPEAQVYYVEQLTDILVSCWLSHSQHIRISSVESILGSSSWEGVKKFIITYGEDLFTQQFLGFRNLRAILHQGVDNWLRSLMHLKREDKTLEVAEHLIDDLMSKKYTLQHAVHYLNLIFECIAENYSEYIDYNSTTTHSDHGEKVYMFLDMLRILTSYERISWNLKPVYWIHDALIRAKCFDAALLWEEKITKKSADISDENIKNYMELSEKYGMWLPCIYERLQERLVRPLQTAQMCGLVGEAIDDVRSEEGTKGSFTKLEEQIESFAKAPTGTGFELPEWLNILQDEVMNYQAKKGRTENQLQMEDVINPLPKFEQVKLSRDDIARQLKYARNNINFSE